MRQSSASFKLAAVDLDGTLLGPDLQISADNRAALARMQALGIEVVLVSGRHFQSIREFAASIPGIAWIISVQGGEVSRVDRSIILAQRFLPVDETERIARLGISRGQMVVGYSSASGQVLRGREEFLGFYSSLAGHPLEMVDLDTFVDSPVHKVVLAGAEASIEALANDHALLSSLSERVRSHRRLLEFMPPGVTKASGLATLGAHLGISATEMVAFGDADNDVPMFEWTGRGVAMGHAWPAALASACLIAPSGAEETAFARAVNIVLATK